MAGFYIGLLIIAGFVLILWFIFRKGPITKAAIDDTTNKELAKEEKRDTLLPESETKTSSVSKKKKYYLKGLRDNAIAEQRRTMSLKTRPLKTFGSWAPIRYFNQKKEK